MKRYVWSVVIFIAVLVVGGFLYVWSGLYDIAATKPHRGITLQLIEVLRDRSIKVHSDGIQVPNLDDPKLREAAFPHFQEMCRLCHGAPGYEPDELAKGLYPAPPSMVSGHIQESLNDREIYWIVKNGIKMTGMPAFGPTHSNEELWGLVAVTKEIPQMRPGQYRQSVRERGLE